MFGQSFFISRLARKAAQGFGLSNAASKWLGRCVGIVGGCLTGDPGGAFAALVDGGIDAAVDSAGDSALDAATDAVADTSVDGATEGTLDMTLDQATGSNSISDEALPDAEVVTAGEVDREVDRADLPRKDSVAERLSSGEGHGTAEGMNAITRNARLLASAGLVTGAMLLRPRPSAPERDIERIIREAYAVAAAADFVEWAGDERATLAVVFTDIVSSVSYWTSLGDMRAYESVFAPHLLQAEQLIQQYRGRLIHSTGDGVLAVFRSVNRALEYVYTLKRNPGNCHIQIRAGVHIGPIQVERNDAHGSAIAFASRITDEIRGAQIWLSNQAKADMDQYRTDLVWRRIDDRVFKGFPGSYTVWEVVAQ